ncbi:uncharacterized protein LOC129738931 [Uranotaenia lowii]|uniref:uncharacterized protein LOC129738931 n=1 Tax=Uranotaenia lowii TaxID=190385 RepID=UPI00247A8C8F|nr:uncharacterized protein LOC129738931 [Uranotaenia lowii]
MDKIKSHTLISDVKNKDELFDLIVSELRGHGIKYRKDKRTKSGQDKGRCKRIFNAPLHTLELTDVILANGRVAQVPLFVSDACQRILEQVNTEGLFRKAGSSKRQQEIKASLETGIPLGKSHHVIDVANLLKSFFRDLPEPLLPTGNIQEALIRCLLSGEHKVYDLMITCLLLPPITLNTMAFFMQFLHTVSLHCSANKMTIENLAIILTPNLMPIAEMVQQRLTTHVKIVQLLIENSHEIGVVPDTILEKLNESNYTMMRIQSVDTGSTTVNTTDKKKKKRRSGSLTRMFHGLRKIVGAIGSSESLDKTDDFLDKESTTSGTTPCLNKSSKKRKVTDGMPFSAKKKKEVVSSLPDNQEILPYTPIAIMKEAKKSRLSLGGGNKHKSVSGKNAALPITSLVDDKPMERRWSVVGAPWARKKPHNRNKTTAKKNDKSACGSGSSEFGFGNKTGHEDDGEAAKILSELSPVVSLPNLSTPGLQKEVNLFDQQNDQPVLKGKALFQDEDSERKDEHDNEEYVRISKSEYEAIKERVSAIETRISQEFGSIVACGNATNSNCEVISLDRVENKYQQVLEQTEPIEASCSTTDQLAKRLSRELKIRRSSEHKVMRSPSARKIGTIRRRSRENVRLSRNQSWHVATTSATSTKPWLPIVSDHSFYPKTNLKRGRPNTVQSGLKQPDLSPSKPKEDESVTTFDQNITDEQKKQDEKWTCAQSFFDELMGSPSKPSEPTDEIFKTPEVTITPRRTSLRSLNSSKKNTPHYVTKIEVGGIKTPMLPPVIPPRKTSAKTPMFPPRTPGRIDSVVLKTHLTPLQDAQSGRASIARLRSQNAGMVMAKAKLFDGMVSNVNQPSKHNPQLNRRQSNKFTVKTSADGSQILNPVMQVPENIQLRQVKKVRSISSNDNAKSPRRLNTPRKRAITKSPHGGINRREILRLAAKSPSASKILQSTPKIIRSLQNDPNILKNMNATDREMVTGFSLNMFDLDNKTPQFKKQMIRNSPRRLISGASPHGRENRPRKQTPLKATPLSKLALTAELSNRSNNADKSPRTYKRESPRLLANMVNQAPRRSSSANSLIRP